MTFVFGYNFAKVSVKPVEGATEEVAETQV